MTLNMWHCEPGPGKNKLICNSFQLIDIKEAQFTIFSKCTVALFIFPKQYIVITILVLYRERFMGKYVLSSSCLQQVIIYCNECFIAKLKKSIVMPQYIATYFYPALLWTYNHLSGMTTLFVFVTMTFGMCFDISRIVINRENIKRFLQNRHVCTYNVKLRES